MGLKQVKMKIGSIKNIESYRDGGSVEIEMKSGSWFWIDNRAMSDGNPNKGELYCGKRGDSYNKVVDMGLISILIEKIEQYERKCKYKIMTAQQAIEQLKNKIMKDKKYYFFRDLNHDDNLLGGLSFHAAGLVDKLYSKLDTPSKSGKDAAISYIHPFEGVVYGEWRSLGEIELFEVSEHVFKELEEKMETNVK